MFRARQSANDKRILALMEKADQVGIDVPLGWPTEFVRAVYRHHAQKKKWPKVSMRRFRLGATDRFVAEKTRIWPLSVSNIDRIAVKTRDKKGGRRYYRWL
jgi:hypothetical protein